VPELPEVETVRRLLAPVLVGERIVEVVLRRADLRGPFPAGFASRLTGHTVLELHRRAKHLLADLSSRETLLMHLGMSGDFRVEQGGAAQPLDRHDHVIVRLASGAVVTFNDPRRFGSMDLVPTDALAEHPVIGALGPEPLSASFTPAVLARACRGRKAAIKVALLDQRVVAGLGNIYVCEALFRSHLSPRRLAATLATKKGEPTDHSKRLVTSIHGVLNQAIKAGGSSISDHRLTSGELGYFQHSFQVYDREGENCQTAGCGGIVRRFVQNGRSTFWCPKCQK
jgi:formamidopyrimidine-DNA glycosylase